MGKKESNELHSDKALIMPKDVRSVEIEFTLEVFIDDLHRFARKFQDVGRLSSKSKHTSRKLSEAWKQVGYRIFEAHRCGLLSEDLTNYIEHRIPQGSFGDKEAGELWFLCIGPWLKANGLKGDLKPGAFPTSFGTLTDLDEPDLINHHLDLADNSQDACYALIRICENKRTRSAKVFKVKPNEIKKSGTPTLTRKKAWPWKDQEKPLKDVAVHLAPLVNRSVRTIREWSVKYGWCGKAKRLDDRAIAVEKGIIIKTLEEMKLISSSIKK